MSICNVVLSSSTLISLPSLFKPMNLSLSVIEGSYALIAAHIVNVVTNGEEM